MRLTCRSNCSTIKACTLACARVRGLRLCSKARWLHYIYRALPNICLACTIYKYYMCWYMSNKQIVYVPPVHNLCQQRGHSMLVLPIVLVLLEGICLSCGEISAQPTLLQSQHHCQSLYIQWMKYCPCLPQSTLHTTTLPIKWRGGRVNAGDYKSVYIHFTFNVSFGQHCYYYCCYLFLFIIVVIFTIIIILVPLPIMQLLTSQMKKERREFSTTARPPTHTSLFIQQHFAFF